MKALRQIAVILVALTAPALAGTIDPIAIIQSRLKTIQRDLPVTYRTNSAEVYCTVHCGDSEARTAVYEAFRGLQTLALSSTTHPPEVCVVMVFDPVEFQSQLVPKMLESNLKGVSRAIRGKVLQKNDDGLLIAYDDRVDLVIDAPSGFVDNDTFSHVCYWMGEEYRYKGSDGSLNTVRKYTCSRAAAARRWAPLAATQAKEETDKRVTR